MKQGKKKERGWNLDGQATVFRDNGKQQVGKKNYFQFLRDPH